MTSRETTGFLPLEGGTAPSGRSLADRLFTIAFATVQWPWLLRSLSGGPDEDRLALLRRLDLPDLAIPNLGSWKADAGFLHALVDLVEARRPRQVVEFGVGASTLVLARALARAGGGRLTSFDQHAGFVDATRLWLQDHGVEADLRFAPLAEPPRGWPGAWYRADELPGEIDLLVVDGPPWTIHPFTRGAAESCFDRIPVGGSVVLDDAARPGERVIVARWRRRWPDFEFRRLAGGTKGTVVGTRLR